MRKRILLEWLNLMNHICINKLSIENKFLVFDYDDLLYTNTNPLYFMTKHELYTSIRKAFVSLNKLEKNIIIRKIINDNFNNTIICNSFAEEIKLKISLYHLYLNFLNIYYGNLENKIKDDSSHQNIYINKYFDGKFRVEIYRELINNTYT